MEAGELLAREECKSQGLVSSNREWATLMKSGAITLQKYQDCYIVTIGKTRKLVIADNPNSLFGKICEESGVPMVYLA